MLLERVKPMARRLRHYIQLLKGEPIRLPPGVERIATNAGVFKMIENGLELATVSFDDEECPREALFVFGDDQVVRYRSGQARASR